MNNQFQNIDDLLGKYLAGEASEEERVLVREWLSSGDGNLRYFEQVKMIFEKAPRVKELQEFNTDVAWNNVKNRLKKDSGIIPMQPNRSPALWYRIAAAIIILFGVGWFLLRPVNTTDGVHLREFVAERTAVSDTLPDGSDIVLNKKSALVYAYDRRAKKHEVTLKGEAYFNINNRKKEDFIVDAGGVFIRDIGTSFNVKAYPDTDEVEVLVEEGEVVFFTADNSGIRLRESGKGVYNRKTRSFSIEQPEPNITAYKTKFFVFTRTDLNTMAEALNNVYDVPVVIPDKLKGCTITVTFRDEPIEEIAAVVAETLGLSVIRENNQIRLEGEGCQ